MDAPTYAQIGVADSVEHDPTEGSHLKWLGVDCLWLQHWTGREEAS
jgi:hypothetical protein